MSDLIWATVVDLVALSEQAYLVKLSESEQVVGHFTVVPSPEVYGRQESETIPSDWRYLHASARFPPLQPMLLESHSTMSSGERTTFTLPDEAMQNLSERVSEAANAQHDPHCCWSLIGWMHPEKYSLASNSSGTAVISNPWLKSKPASSPKMVPINPLICS